MCVGGVCVSAVLVRFCCYTFFLPSYLAHIWLHFYSIVRYVCRRTVGMWCMRHHTIHLSENSRRTRRYKKQTTHSAKNTRNASKRNPKSVPIELLTFLQLVLLWLLLFSILFWSYRFTVRVVLLRSRPMFPYNQIDPSTCILTGGNWCVAVAFKSASIRNVRC